jgi:two-component system chemotaxis sensor kinase CheA
VSNIGTGVQNNWVDSFLQEAEDLLTEIEDAALELCKGEATETVNRIFRAFHTMKGSSGMCGLTAVADFTHHVETLLEKIRSGTVSATPMLADLVLAGRDHVRAIIAAEQGGDPVPVNSSERLIERLKAFGGEGSKAVQPTPSSAHAEVPVVLESNSREKVWDIRFHPYPGLLNCGGNPILLMRDLAALGTCEVITHTDAVPPLEEMVPTVCYLWWSATLHTSADLDSIRDVFMFAEDGSELEIKALARAETSVSPDVSDIGVKPDHTEIMEEQPSSTSADAQKMEPASTRVLMRESTVRVPSGRLDRLVNLVGELVMNQSRLTQMMTQIGAPELANPVQEIERLVAELRDDVLGIRMLPIGTLFSRFRRMIHDLAQELGKEVDLITEGAETELDKSILDQLGEPLVHLLRNSIDHGIETAEERVAIGKSRRGTIRLRAVHTGSTVIVSIEDDGRGINRAAVRAKAVEKELISSDANLSDKEILNLLLQPGFSTAKTITNISGRGVGMDVVKRQIDLLRGSVLIASEEGKGSVMSLTLPLTLAIIEGLLVQVDDSRLIFPMFAVRENVELLASERRCKNSRNVISVRGELIPYIDLRPLFEMNGEVPEIEKIVIVEHEDQRVGFVVDRVLGTHQTVLQPLGRFFRSVTVASGATIMGDGGVALILDVNSVIELANQQARRAPVHHIPNDAINTTNTLALSVEVPATALAG